MKCTTSPSRVVESWAACAWASMGLGEASSWFDGNVIDGAVNGAGWLTRFSRDAVDVVGQVDHRRRLVNGPAILARMLELSGAAVRVGPGAVVRAGHDCGAGRVRVLLRVSLTSDQHASLS